MSSKKILINKLLKIELFLAALHLAALHNQTNVVDYLLAQEVDVFTDLLGLSPLDYAKKGNNSAIITKLEGKTKELSGNSD